MEATRSNTGEGAHPDLREWLTSLAAAGRLAVAREGVSLIDELAAIAKKLENERAVLFPDPGRRMGFVLCGLAVEFMGLAVAVRGHILPRGTNQR